MVPTKLAVLRPPLPSLVELRVDELAFVGVASLFWVAEVEVGDDATMNVEVNNVVPILIDVEICWTPVRVEMEDVSSPATVDAAEGGGSMFSITKLYH
jgi:hypothetical protein